MCIVDEVLVRAVKVIAILVYTLVFAKNWLIGCDEVLDRYPGIIDPTLSCIIGLGTQLAVKRAPLLVARYLSKTENDERDNNHHYECHHDRHDATLFSLVLGHTAHGNLLPPLITITASLPL